MEEKSAVSGVSTLNGNFYRTKVTDNGDGTFSSTLFRTDAQGNNEVPIAGFGAVGDQVATSINEQNATPEEQQLLADPNSQLSELRKTQTRSLESEFFGQNENQEPNENAEGGSTPASPTPTNTSTPSMMFKYPLKMDDGQDRIKFVPLRLVKSEFGENDRLRIKKPTYETAKNSTPMFIGIQGNIADQNSVTWGAGELNELQRRMANISLKFMRSSDPVGTLAEKLEKFKTRLEGDEGGLASKLKGLGQLYFTQEATGTSGLLSRATGSILNPNLELLFQAPGLRTFQFQFKMSPRSKDEADEVKKIIKEFKKNMAAKVDEGSRLFLKAPSVFKIQYLKGSGDENIHKSLNLIKVCALLNFAVDYTPNGSYMTFSGGDNGDPEASMVTYNLAMTFQEIEPIYDADYEGEYEYGDGTKAPANHPIGF